MSTQPEALLEAELVTQLRGMGYGHVVMFAKAAGMAQAHSRKKSLLHQMFV